MREYTRPHIEPVEFRDDEGNIIDYGNRWASFGGFLGTGDSIGVLLLLRPLGGREFMLPTWFRKLPVVKVNASAIAKR